MASSSSSEADNNDCCNDEVPSSPLPLRHNATDEESNSSRESTQSHKSPSSKRRRYGLYLQDPSVEVPRETLRRWNLTGSSDPHLTSSKSASTLNPGSGSSQDARSSGQSTQDAGSRDQLTQDVISGDESMAQQDSEDSEGLSNAEYETNSTDSDTAMTESEIEESASGFRQHFDSDVPNSTINSPNSPANSDNLNLSENSDEEFECDNSSDDSDSEDHLFKGSPKTTDEAVLDVCKLFLKHRWSKASLGDTLKVMASTFPQPNFMPSSLANLKNYLNVSSLPCGKKPFYYCSTCLQLKELQSYHCDKCDTDLSGTFYYFSVAEQIRYLFECDNLSSAIEEYRSVRNSAADVQQEELCDLLDGSEYKRVRSYANGRYDVTLIWNTDGVSLSDSSDVKFYPLLSTIAEVAPRLRSQYLMVHSIWVDASAPAMSMYLKPFADELREIYEAGGFEWIHPNTGELVKSQVVAPLFIGDAPVRGDVLKVMRYNAIRGCEKCEAKAVKLPPKGGKGRSLRRFVYTETPAIERTKTRMHLQGRHAKANGKKHVKGVKGKSIVDYFPLLDRACCTLAEYMHCVLLGVTCQFAILWFTKPGPWFMGTSRIAVDAFISSIKVLDFMRDARKISKLTQFKASEFRSWLLFFSLPALQEANFPDVYFQHWVLFVKYVYLLLQDKITESDLKTAELMLRCFLRDIEKLYSNYEYVYNVHHLSHLTKYVRQWGPLSKVSAFLFENYNGVLSRMVHGTKHQAVELTENLKLARGIHILEIKVKNRVSCDSVTDSVVSVSGKAGRITLTNEDDRILISAGIAEFQTYRRATFKGVVYTSRAYDEKKKKCNSLVEFNDANGQVCRGEIICFVRTAEKVVSYVEKFKVQQTQIIYHRETMQKILHLLPVARSNERVLVELSSIVCKVFKVGQFIAFQPNRYEKNL